MLKVLKRLPQTHSFQFIIILKGWWRRLEAQENKMYPNSTIQEKETLTPHYSNSNNATTHISQTDSIRELDFNIR